MNTIAEKITALNALVLQGKSLEAFEIFYHPEVSMQENEHSPVIGKDTNRLREIDFYNKISGIKASPLDVTIGDNVTMVKWHYEYQHQEWGNKNYTQVSVQHWQDGLIIKEQFFYGN